MIEQTSLEKLQKALLKKAKTTDQIFELWRKYAKLGFSEVPEVIMEQINASWVSVDEFVRLFSVFAASQAQREQALAKDNANIHFLYEQAQSENDRLVACCEKMEAIRKLLERQPLPEAFDDADDFISQYKHWTEKLKELLLGEGSSAKGSERERSLRKRTGKQWAWFFYQELGYRIVEDGETELALKKAMGKILDEAFVGPSDKKLHQETGEKPE